MAYLKNTSLAPLPHALALLCEVICRELLHLLNGSELCYLHDNWVKVHIVLSNTQQPRTNGCPYKGMASTVISANKSAANSSDDGLSNYFLG